METILNIQNCIAQMPYANYAGSPVSLDIKRGEIISILGPDYSGKMEWLRTFAGLSDPLDGKIVTGTINTRCQNRGQWEQLRRRLAYVSSSTSLLSAANGLANVILPAKYHQLDETGALRDKAISLMTDLGVQHQQSALPAFMRRDQCHRLALARALILDPAVLILEDPFAHTDSAGSYRLKQFLLAHVKKHEIALIVMSHDIEFSLKHSQQILFVSREQVYCFNSAEEFSASQIASIRQYLDKPGTH
jgi:ABC-type transporter Mla maintaining outer membrane lipid asymmetry ATPase subunit MlaF